MERQLFIETIDALKKQYEHDAKCTELMEQIYPDTFASGYKNSFVCEALIRLLQVAMEDEHLYSWIDYYIHELDFGKKYKKGCATNSDGSNINLSNAGTLYDFLIANKNTVEL
jgi:hypothetical protein